MSLFILFITKSNLTNLLKFHEINSKKIKFHISKNPLETNWMINNWKVKKMLKFDNIWNYLEYLDCFQLFIKQQLKKLRVNYVLIDWNWIRDISPNDPAKPPNHQNIFLAKLKYFWI